MAEYERLTHKVFPEAVKTGSFGADVRKFICFEAKNQDSADQFSSKIIFGDVTLEKETGERFVQSVVIKTQGCRLPELNFFNYDGLFYNEVLFYSRIIPLLRKYDKDDVLLTSVAEFVYGKATNGENPEEDIIILKDLNQNGFRLTDDVLFIDDKHIKLALDRIAKFHGLSLACQMHDPKRFKEIVSQMKVAVTNTARSGSLFKEFIQSSYQRWLRGVSPLETDPKYREKATDLHAFIDKTLAAGDSFTDKYLKSSGLLTVIPHGDFNRNNMMFKYGRNGVPLEVAFFDFAMIKLCSPAIDISYLLAMNVSPGLRCSYWNDFLRTYYDALSRQLDGYPTKPSFETFELDLRQNGAYGYDVASWLLAATAAIHGEAGIPSLIDVGSMDKSLREKGIRTLESKNQDKGSHKTTELLVEIVKHMLDKMYIF